MRFKRDEFAYVIVDESHHAPADTYRPIVEYFTPKFKLGMTATPTRMDLRDMKKFFGGKETYTLHLDEALVLGLLAKIDYRMITDELFVTGKMEKISNLSIEKLNRKIFTPKRDEEIVRIIHEKIKDVVNPRIMIFCQSIKHAERLSVLLPDSVHVHSGLNRREQRSRINDFRTGKVSIALTVDKFNEGIDIPEVNVVVFLRSTSSEAIFYQQLGRGLRKSPGKESVLVLDFVANCERIEMVYEFVQKMEKAIKNQIFFFAHNKKNGVNEKVINFGDFHFTEVTQDIITILRKLRTGYTKEDLIEQLKAEAVLLGQPPKAKDMSRASKEGRTAHPSVFQRVFGTWNNALELAGFELHRVYAYNENDKENLILKLKVLGQKLNRAPETKDVRFASSQGSFPSKSTFLRIFGSFDKALLLAGYDPTQRRWSKEEMIGHLKMVAYLLGRTPKQEDLEIFSRNNQAPSASGIGKKFGNYSKALKAAELELNKGYHYHLEEATLIKQLQDEAQLLGRTPSSADVNKASKEKRMVSMSTLLRTFGSFEKALEIAGLGKLTPREHRLIKEKERAINPPPIMPSAEGSEIKLPPLSLKVNEKGIGLGKVTIKGIDQYPVLTAVHEKWLAQKIEQGDERAKMLFIQSNYRLVLSITRKKSYRVSDDDALTAQDLFQEGVLGLITAVGKFDWRRDIKFSTYATWWIMQAIMRSLGDKAKTIRVPIHAEETLRRYEKVVQKLYQKFSRKPTPEEIADEMGIDAETIQVMEEVAKNAVLSRIDQPIGGDEEASNLSDFVADQNDLSDVVLDKKNLVKEIKKILSSSNFSLAERLVIEMRYGLVDGVDHTLEDVGKLFGLTRERIRQVEIKILDKLRSIDAFKYLENW